MTKKGYSVYICTNKGVFLIKHVSSSFIREEISCIDCDKGYSLQSLLQIGQTKIVLFLINFKVGQSLFFDLDLEQVDRRRYLLRIGVSFSWARNFPHLELTISAS